MKVKCRGFEGQILSLEAEALGQNIYGIINVESYCLNFQQQTGEIIHICGLSDKDFEVLK